MSEYQERDLQGLDCPGNYYCRHVSAMTHEGLYSKSDIAAELGYRDREIDRLNERLYQAFKAGCLSANDGIFPDAFEEEIKVLFEEWKNGK